MRTGSVARMPCPALAAGGLAVVLWLAWAAPALGVTISAPADVPRSATVTVTVEADDPLGTVYLNVDGSDIATAPGGPGDVIVFPAVSLAPGPHKLVGAVSDGRWSVESAPLRITSWGVPSAPVLLRPTGDSLAGAADVLVRAGAWTSRLEVLVNGTPVGGRSCTPGQAVPLGVIGVPRGYQVWTVIGTNPCGERAETVVQFSYVPYPASTCIVVDKSEFRLYWIQNDILIRMYSIAIGKPRTPTPNGYWIVNRREYMPPSGVYGPRRLKLARRYWTRRGWRWKATGYGIHGTNEPWVIGTMASHGCIRLRNDMILDLWPQVPLGTLVETRQ